MKKLISIQKVEDAHRNIKDFAKVTPLLFSEAFENKQGFKLILKAENLQTTNSFKIRGSSNCIINKVKATPEIKGVVTASSGNHGQAVAYVAYKLGLPAMIVMPETAPRAKINAVSGWKAKIELCGTTSGERLVRMQQIAKEEGYFVVPPYDHYDIIAGQGTIGKEILEQLPDVDVVLVPVGGGGLISGISYYIKNANPKVKVIGVEPEKSNSMYVSLEKGAITRLDKTRSIADGLLSLEPGSLTFPIVKEYVDEVITVSENEISEAVGKCIKYYKTVPEPSGAVSVAGALKGDWGAGKKVVPVVSGGNFDMSSLSAFIEA